MVNSEIKIQWLTKSKAMYSYFNSDQGTQYTGGTLYEVDAIKYLQKHYDVSVNINYIKNENFIKYYFKNHRTSIDANICFLDPYVVAINKIDFSKYNVAIIHHIDESIAEKSFFGKLFLKRLIKNLKKVNEVIVVSQYWKSYLEKRGVKSIHIIYNSYSLSDFELENVQVNSFKERLNLSENKPVIYLGKYGEGKGIDLILSNIDHSKYNLITTGKNVPERDGLKSLYLSKNEFPMLLKIADVVLAMSTMPEGWNRIAHEALLVKTPVIGSGTGGMRELLERSGQKIVEDYSRLDEEIETCIKNKIQLGDSGYNFVKQFDMHYFESHWLGLISQIEVKLN